MLYIRLEDHQLHLASYAAPSPQQREEALILGKVLTDAPVLTIARKELAPVTGVQQSLVSTASVQQALGELRELVPDFNAYVRNSPVTVLVSGPATLVPDDEIEAEDDAFIFNSCFSFTDHAQRRVCSDHLVGLRQRLVYGVPKGAVEAIVQEFRYPELRFVSTLTPLLQHFAEAEGSRDADVRLYVNCRYRFVDVFAISRQRLQLLNSFPVNTPDDATYYVLALLKTMGYGLATTPVGVLGEASMTAALAGRLSRFVRNVTLLDAAATFGNPSTALDVDVPCDLLAHISLLNH